MQIGIVANIFQDLPLEEALQKFHEKGIHFIEPGCGGYAGKAHVNPRKLLEDAKELETFQQLLKKYDMKIAALSCHGNPIHPNKEIREEHQQDMKDAVQLAQKLGVDTITCFSGCAGDCPESMYPNWVTCAWPEDNLKILDYQWNEVLIPYWKDFVEYARLYGVTKIAFEMHPGFMVYNVETLKRLRDAVGNEIGANLDPSHIVWQGMDPVAVIRALQGMVYHFHAKDVKVDSINASVNGVLDTKHYGDELNRSWIFRTVGYGHDVSYWKEIVSTLRKIGYDGVISIEHEDSLMNREEGLDKALQVVKECIMTEEKSKITWA